MYPAVYVLWIHISAIVWHSISHFPPVNLSSTFLPICLAPLQKHFSCFWNPVKKQLLIFIHCIYLSMTHKKYSFSPDHPSTLQYLSSFVICFLFCHLCLFKYVCQPCLPHPQKGTSPAAPVESISLEELLFHECFLMVRHPQTFLTAFILEPSVHLCCLAMPLPSFSEDWKASTECCAHGNIIATWLDENVFHVVYTAPF